MCVRVFIFYCYCYTTAVLQEVDRLNEAKEAQAAGVKAMLEESQAKESEAAARIQLLEVKSAHDVFLAKEEVYILYTAVYQ